MDMPAVKANGALWNAENARAKLELLNADMQTKRNAIMAVVADDLAALEEEYAPTLEAARKEVENADAALKAQVILLGESVKGEWIHAIYSKPRETWDSKRLDGYAAAHPEVLAFKKVGEPTVSIRAAK